MDGNSEQRKMSRLRRSVSPEFIIGYSLCVRNISYQTSELTLLRLFGKCGKVLNIDIPIKQNRPGLSQGYAFVRYKYEDEANEAVERINGEVVDGRRISVEFSKYGPRRESLDEVERRNRSRYRSRSPRPSDEVERRNRSRYRSRSPRPRDRDYRSKRKNESDDDGVGGREQDDHHGSRSHNASASRGRDHHRYGYDGSSGVNDRNRGRDDAESRRRSRSENERSNNNPPLSQIPFSENKGLERSFASASRPPRSNESRQRRPQSPDEAEEARSRGGNIKKEQSPAGPGPAGQQAIDSRKSCRGAYMRRA